MPIRSNIFFAGNYYHIYNRGANRQNILMNEMNYTYCLDIISEYAKKYNIAMIAFCLMPVIRYHLPTGQAGLPVESRVTLKIYNLLGQEVKTLVAEVKEAGYQSVEWNSTNNLGNSLASGVYFYRMEATSAADPSKQFTQVRKLLLLK